MIRKPVLSTNLRSVGYDQNEKRLEVEFHDGSVYSYYDVEAHEHHGLMSAESMGGHLHRFIKAKHRHEKH